MKRYLFFLEDWELARAALRSHVALHMLCPRSGSWLLLPRGPFVTARKLSSHRERAVTIKEKGCGERSRSKEESGTGLCGLSGLVGILLLRMFVVVWPYGNE